MGRGKIVIRRIDDLASRQVTLSKRKTGLLKKARELSILCEAEVGVIVFSSTGRLYEYASTTSMKYIIERYEELREGHFQLFDSASNSELKIWQREAGSLRKDLEYLQHQHRQVLGQELSGLGMDELQNLESQVETSLEAIRKRKGKISIDEMNELKQKANLIYQENLNLYQEIDHIRQENLELQKKVCGGRDVNVNANTSSHSPRNSSNENGINTSILHQLSQSQFQNDNTQDESLNLRLGLD